MKREHICFISNGVYNYLKPGKREKGGGAERQQYLMGCELQDRGYDVSYIVGNFDQPEHEIIDDFEVWKMIPKSRGITSIPLRFTKLYQAIRAVNADMYYIRGHPLRFILTSSILNIFGKDYTYAVANDKNVGKIDGSLTQRIQKRLYYFFMNQADVVTVQTKSQQRMLNDHHRIQANIVPNGYSLPPTNDIKPADSRSHVLWVGSLNKNQKRPERFLKIAEELQNMKFVMIGTKSGSIQWDEKIQRKASKIDNVQYLDFVSPDEIHKYYQNASLLVNTSQYEGFPNVFLEAWRYETPVISMGIDVDNLIERTKIGIIVQKIDDAVTEIQRLHLSPEQRELMGHKARMTVKEQFSIESTTDKLLNAMFDKSI